MVGWWYAYAVQRMVTPPFNKVMATNGVVKQQVQIKHIKNNGSLHNRCREHSSSL